MDAEVSDLAEPENRFETEPKLLEVYSRIDAEGEPLLFEAYFRYGGVTDAGGDCGRNFAPITLGALILLELVQIPLAWSMARRFTPAQQGSGATAPSGPRRIGHRTATDRQRPPRRRRAGVGRRAPLALAAQGREDSIDPQQVVQASADIRSSIKSLRSLLVEIYPANLEEEGLQSAVGDLLNVLAAHGISTRLVADLQVNRIDLEASTLAYRVAQEALRNVVSHAAATEVRATIDVQDDSLILIVDDNGKGFSTDVLDERTADGHVGLRSLAGLAADLHGSLQVRSSPGTGTRVQVTIPINDRMDR